MEPMTSPDASAPTAGDPYLDTVALLQEEVARLEAELRMRDDAAPSIEPRPASPADDAAERRIEELTAQLAERDEAIGLLWDQLAALEEAQAARSAEWEQLHSWIEALEARVGDGETEGPRPDPDEWRREAETLRDRLDTERKAWQVQRERLQGELAALRAGIDERAEADGDPAQAALAEENRRLRDECRRLADAGSAAEQAGATRERELRLELERLGKELEAARDDLRNEQLRHEAELAALRSEQAQAPGRLSAADLSPNERVRALREHFRDLQAREDQERRERQLSARIARLWQRTGAR